MTPLRKAHILLVDDEGPILLTYRLIFEQEGYSVTCARNTPEATAALQREQFDLLICDLALEEGKSGLEIIHFARRENPQLPCVLLTGYPDAEMPRIARENRIQLLFKPVEVASVLNTIDFLLRQKHTPQDKAAGRRRV